MSCPHCKVHIDEHEALPCLDTWVADEVLEWVWLPTSARFNDDGTQRFGDPLFSKKIEEAWKVVEKLAEWNVIISVAWGNGADGRKYASVQIAKDLFKELLRPIREMDGKAHKAPLAICRAAIKATAKESE